MTDFASKILFKLLHFIKIFFEQNFIYYTLWHICIQAREGEAEGPVNKLEELEKELSYR